MESGVMSRWRIGILARLYPELRLFEHDKDREQAWSAAYTAWLPLAVALLTLVGVGTGRYLADAATSQLSKPQSLPSNSLRLICGLFHGFTAACVLLGVVVIPYSIWAHRFRRSLRRSLIAAGVPVCLHCCYDVRGQTEPRCPECGREFSPELRSLWGSLRAAQPGPDPQLTNEQLTQPLTTDN
jgi:hypothetical protein